MDNSKFYTIEQVRILLQKNGKKACYETARRMVQRWNRELTEKGYTVFRGIVPRRYVKERMWL